MLPNRTSFHLRENCVCPSMEAITNWILRLRLTESTNRCQDTSTIYAVSTNSQLPRQLLLLANSCKHYKSKKCREVEQGHKGSWESFVRDFQRQTWVCRPKVCLQKSWRNFLTNHEGKVLPPNIWSFYSVWQTWELSYLFSVENC